MAGRISSMFQALKGSRAALIAYATGYYPERDRSASVIRAMFDSGADAVEIGLPFSDPVMDGPVIQESSRVALKQGATVAGILDLAAEVRGYTEKPLLVMSYYNPILRYGPRSFAEKAFESGVDGVIIPDLPVEEMLSWKVDCDRSGIETVAFCSTTTSPERISAASSMSSGFLYCISVLGTTGARDTIPEELPAFLKRVRANASCPIAVGVGISTPAQCSQAGKLADGVIVGSALVSVVASGGDLIEALGEKVKALSASLI